MKPGYAAQFILITLVFYACKTVPVTGRKQLNLVPNSIIQAMAFSQYDSVVKVSPTLSQTDERAQLVTTVGTNIQQAVETYMQQNNMSKDLRNFKWEYNTINENIVNAWCMPGGKVVVYTGLLPVTQNETALAVVMGHEIAHAIARHGNERMSQGLLLQLGGVAFDVATSSKPEETRQLFQLAYGIGATVGVMLPYSRKHETEADRMGLIFMSMAGYNPNEAVGFWGRMAAKSGGGGKQPVWLSTHPSDAQRISDIKSRMGEAMKYYNASVKSGGNGRY